MSFGEEPRQVGNTSATRRPHVFTRGLVLTKGDQVTAGTPASLPPLPEGRADRLALAKWMASKDNSLTARVAVNRVWASLFGTGIDGRWHVTNHAAIWRCREANHPPIAKLAHADRLTARKGDVVQLNAERSSDPDGDKLSCKWFYYGEAGTFLCSRGTPGQPVPIDGFDQAKATFTVPTRTVMPPGVGTMHIVLAVTDHGSPRLTRYRRVIVDVKE